MGIAIHPRRNQASMIPIRIPGSAPQRRPRLPPLLGIAASIHHFSGEPRISTRPGSLRKPSRAALRRPVPRSTGVPRSKSEGSSREPGKTNHPSTTLASTQTAEDILRANILSLYSVLWTDHLSLGLPSWLGV